jgi:hypothetical protein
MEVNGPVKESGGGGGFFGLLMMILSDRGANSQAAWCPVRGHRQSRDESSKGQAGLAA